MKAARRCGVMLGVLVLGLRVSPAHPALFTSAQIYIQPDGQYQLFTSFDLLAFALQKTSVEIGDPPMNALLDGPPDVLAKKIADARAYFFQNIKLQTDRGPARVTLARFPTLQDVEDWKALGKKPRLPVVARVQMNGQLPSTATSIRLQFPLALGSVVLTVERPGDQTDDEPIEAGSPSSAVAIHLSPAGSLPVPTGKPAP
jgi:hypothetical protein